MGLRLVRNLVFAVFVGALVAGCSSQQSALGANGGPNGKATNAADAATSNDEAHMRDAAAVPSQAAPDSAVANERSEESEAPSFAAIATVLFADRDNPGAASAACPESIPAEARIRCLFDERYRGDRKAASLAHELFAKWRIVAGVEAAYTMDGGYRGMIRLVPALPVVAERHHLEWIVGAMRDIDAFFTEFASFAKTHEQSARPHPKRYRFKPLTLRFMRSVAARTPSAYAHDATSDEVARLRVVGARAPSWTVAYNLAGSLNTSPDAVRETFVHEIFHLNDYVHPPPGGEAWSFGALGATFDTIVKKCGTAIACLTPYTPNETVVRGGTYYSFQPGNGVREYAAELALRYYREQRAVLRALPKVKAFKCGPAENARAWTLMRDEFFEGVDVVPACT